MFVKETKVKRSGREYVYLQLVDGYRDGKARSSIVLWQTLAGRTR